MTIRPDRGPRQFQSDARFNREGRPDGACPPFTLPRLLMANAELFGARVAIREKEYGIWHRYTWADYLERAGAVALGLARLGFRRGDRLAIVGGNRPQLYWTFLAAECLGGIPVPIYQDAAAGELQYIIAQAEASIVVAEDQEQVDKVLEVRAQLPALAHVIYTDPRGMRRYAAPDLRSFASVLEEGREEAARRPGAIQEAIHSGAPDDVALISFTSGTTGVPKGVMLSHRALIATGEGALQVVPVHAGDEMLAYLPIGWLGDTFFSLIIPLLTGAAINCPEDATTVRQDFREIGPTVAFAPPRIWESLLAECRVRIEGADWVKRRLTQPFVASAMRTTRQAFGNGAASPADRVLRALGEPLVFAPLRDQLGLRRIRLAITGGAPIAPEVLQFFWGIGVNLTQLYGLTECSTLVTVHPDGKVEPESVGLPIPGVEIRIGEGGEILVASPGLFSGYYRDPGSTAEALRDGWLRTGDAGRIDPNGHLVVLDRVEDVSHLDDGTVFAPQRVENKLKFSPYIKEAMVVGHPRAYVAAILNIDADAVGTWAQRRKIAYSGYTDLAQSPQVYELLAGEVGRINDALAAAVRVKRFAVLHKELDPDDAEMTRTRKLRRRVVAEKYAAVIDALYDPAAVEVAVPAIVQDEDGRHLETQRVLRLHTMG